MWPFLRLWTGQLRGSQRATPKELAKLITEVEHGKVARGHSISLGDLVQRSLDGNGPRRMATRPRSTGPALNSSGLDADTSTKYGPTAR
jgi:hypothetical protein